MKYLKASLFAIGAALLGAAPHTASAASDNPWPDAYSRRDFQLGMTISAFKSVPYPDLKDQPGAYSVCSNDARAAKMDYVMVQVLDEQMRKAGIVICRFFRDQKITANFVMVMDAGLGLVDQQLDTAFYFLPDEQGKLRLFWIVTRGPASLFDRFAAIMTKAYGAPATKVEKWQNRIGNTFDNQVDLWSTTSSEIEFRQLGDSSDVFRLEHRLKPLWQRFSSQMDAADSEAAKRL